MSTHAHRLEKALQTLDLVLPSATQDALLAYLGLIARWNAVYNLTAIRDPDEMLVQHLFDCLAAVPTFDRVLGANAEATVLDVGSGAGLPGVVLALCRPAWQVHCVDTVGKKAAFLTQVRVELGFGNLRAHHARVEALRVDQQLSPCQIITSRAFSSLGQFVRCSRHLLAPRGSWLALKAQRPDDELATLPAGVQVVEEIMLQVPELEAQRRLYRMQPQAAEAASSPDESDR